MPNRFRTAEKARFAAWVDARRDRLAALTPAAALAESGCAIGYETARRVLRAAGQPGPPRRVVDWSAADWSRPNWEVARALGVTPTMVLARREREGRPKVAARTGPRPDGKPRARRPGRWDGVDWSLADVAIAAGLGVSKQAVGEQRRRRGKLGARPGAAGGGAR